MASFDDKKDTRPPPKDLWHHLSRSTRARHPSVVKDFYKYFTIPGIGQFAGGLPNDSYFPFDTLEARVARPNRWEPTKNEPVDPPPFDSLAGLSLDADDKKSVPPQDAIVVPHASNDSDPMKKIDLKTALQYGTSEGYPPLLYFCRNFARDVVHVNCPYKGGPEVVMTIGNADGFSKALEACSNLWSPEHDWVKDREGILVEEFAYMNAIQTAEVRGLAIVPVKIDDEGMRIGGPGGLEDVLKNWDPRKGQRPHLMYTVTMGQNPTSGVISLARRREIYKLCSKYDIIIIEDDPYWFLQYPSATAFNTTTTHDPANTSFNPDVRMFANGEPWPEGWKSSGYEFIDSLVPSYISVDTDGRVIRLDTFSKSIAPGCRLGYMTAQPAIIERVCRITETTTQQPSGFVQSVIAEVINGPDHPVPSKPSKDRINEGSGWKTDGWVRWLEGLRGNYERRMRQMSQILESERFLVKAGRRNSLAEAVSSEEEADEWSVVEKTELYSFTWPVGGMFLWMRVSFENHPLYHTYEKLGELEKLSKALWILWTTKPYRVLVAPGSMFAPTPAVREKDGWRFFRLSFAAIDTDLLEPVAKRLRNGTADFFRIKEKKKVEKIIEDDSKEAMAARAADLTRLGGVC